MRYAVRTNEYQSPLTVAKAARRPNDGPGGRSLQRTPLAEFLRQLFVSTFVDRCCEAGLIWRPHGR